MPRWWLSVDAEAADADWRGIPLRSLRAHGNAWLVQFEGVEDRNAAEALTGQYVGAPREALPAISPDEYYWADLIGLTVVNRQGVSLGQVASLIETGANSVLVVRAFESQCGQDGESAGHGGREHLLPFVSAVVDGVDLAARQVRVDWQPDW